MDASMVEKHRRLVLYAALLAAIVVGLLLRSTDLAQVFRPDGTVRLGVDDSWFHARRALYSFFQFPHTLQFDWYLNYPHGAPAPCPPLFDWTIAAVARIFGHDAHTLEVVAAWISPVLAALLALPAFWIGRSVISPAGGLAAAWLVAVLPSGILTTRLGNCDTPAAVALIAGCWLASSLREVGRSGRSLAVHALVHAAIVATLLLTWSGSLLYLGLAEGARLAAIVLLDGRPQRYFAAGASLCLAALPILAWLLVSLPPLGGPFSSQTLSWLHLIALLAIAALAGSLGALERRQPSKSATERGLRASLLGAALATPLLLVPAIREALLHGIDFIGKNDPWAATNPEQAPLFTSLSTKLVRHATTRFGFFAYLVPVTPLVVGAHMLLRGGEQRQRLLIMFCWVTGLCGLVLFQVRYGTDFTVPGAVAFVLALGDVRSLLLRFSRRGVATAGVVALGLLLMAPAWQWDATLLESAHRYQRPGALSGAHQFANHVDIFFAFAREVDRFTPETSGFLDSATRPAYGILVPPTLGHLFTYVARRPVPADNLGPYLNAKSFEDASRFYRTRSSNEAIHLLEQLGVRYVVTLGGMRSPATFSAFLHFDYASAGRSDEPSGRLRLIAQGPVMDSTLVLLNSKAAPQGFPPCELFEFVKGAVLVAHADPGSFVTARIRLSTPVPSPGYEAVARADSRGVARLRVPYPSGRDATVTPGLVEARGDWIVHTRDHDARVAVTETDVREGRDVLVR